jgi:hypothetical protein
MSLRPARLAASLALALAVAGCQGQPPAPAAAPVAPAASPAAGPVIAGQAQLATGPFGGAAIKVFRLDNDAPLGTGETDAQGNFSVTLPAEAAAGLALRVEAAKGGQSLGALATVGGTPVSLKRRVAQAGGRTFTIKLTMASTLALRAFLVRLKGVSATLIPPGQKSIPVNLLERLLSAYDKLNGAAGDLLVTFSESELQALLEGASDTPLPAEILDNLAQPGNPFEQASREVLPELKALADEGVKAGAQPPGTDLTDPTAGNPRGDDAPPAPVDAGSGADADAPAPTPAPDASAAAEVPGTASLNILPGAVATPGAPEAIQ